MDADVVATAEGTCARGKPPRLSHSGERGNRPQGRQRDRQTAAEDHRTGAACVGIVTAKNWWAARRTVSRERARHSRSDTLRLRSTRTDIGSRRTALAATIDAVTGRVSGSALVVIAVIRRTV